MSTQNVTQHTPGPWHIARHASTLIEAESGRHVATSGGYSTNADNGEHHDENDANARLIAAAPDLLAMLEEIESKESHLFGHYTHAQVRAVIGKARGQ